MPAHDTDLQVRAVVGELNNTHKNADAGIPAMAGQTAMLEGQDDEEEPVSTYIEVRWLPSQLSWLV